MSGRLGPVVASLHFHQHHFHGDDGIVHQQAECNDQCPQGDAVEIDAHDQHDHEGDAEREWYRDANHQPCPPADSQYANGDHHQHGNQELDFKQIDGARDDFGLIGEDVQGHAKR
ncbi:hypothetical protein D9M70_337270 [compost metagenome]